MIRAGALLGLLVCGVASAEGLFGRVVRVYDGDTLTIQTATNRERVRLKDIDAPELRQPFGVEARGILRGLCPVDSMAVVTWRQRDRNRRPLALVTCSGVDVNAEMVRTGAAWVYVRTSRKSNLYSIEAGARRARTGLWFSGNPTPPWEWRRARRTRALTSPWRE